MSADGRFPGARIRGLRILRRSWPVLWLMVGMGCADGSVNPDELRVAHLSMAASFPSLANQPAPSIDAWRVTVLRPGEGVVAEEGGGVSPGQASVTVQVSVMLVEDCEVLLVRIQLLAGGEVRYLAEQEHRICAGRTNQVPPVQLQWVGPTIGLAPGQLSFSAAQGTSPSPQTFTVANAGGGTLAWTATTDAAWLSVSPASGSLGPGAARSLTATVASANLGRGQFQASIIVTDPGAANSPRTLPVFLTVMEVTNSVVHGTVSADGVGLSGVAVTLAGAQVLSVVTGSSGAYSFTGLRAGSYAVSLSGYPAGVQFPWTSQSLSLGVSQTRRVDFQGIRYYTLTVTKSGQGTVTSSPAGISISTSGTSDTGVFNAGTQVTLTATPAAGWQVGSWGGSCSGTGTTSTVIMDGNKSCSVTFVQTFATLTVVVDGLGSVSSSGVTPAIACYSDTCSATYPLGTQVTLTATDENADFLFERWFGTGSGFTCTTSRTCQVMMDQDRTVRAWFSAPGLISVDPSTAAFTMLEGGTPTPSSQSITVSNVGDRPVYDVTINTSYSPSTSPWLSATIDRTVIDTLTSGTMTLSVYSNDLDPGTYQATVYVGDFVITVGQVQVTLTVQSSTPVISNISYVLEGINHSICSYMDPPGSLFSVYFDYSDATGDVALLGDSVVAVAYQFQGGSSGIFYQPPEPGLSIGGDGFTGRVRSMQCHRFGGSSGLTVTHTLRDGDRNVSNSLAIFISKPSGANAPPSDSAATSLGVAAPVAGGAGVSGPGGGGEGAKEGPAPATVDANPLRSRGPQLPSSRPRSRFRLW